MCKIGRQADSAIFPMATANLRLIDKSWAAFSCGSYAAKPRIIHNFELISAFFMGTSGFFPIR